MEPELEYQCFVHSSIPTLVTKSAEEAFQFYKANSGCRVYKRYKVGNIYPKGGFVRWL